MECELIRPLKGLAENPAHQDPDHFAFVLGGAAVIVHGIDFRRRDLAPLDQRGLVDRLAAQYFLSVRLKSCQALGAIKILQDTFVAHDHPLSAVLVAQQHRLAARITSDLPQFQKKRTVEENRVAAAAFKLGPDQRSEGFSMTLKESIDKVGSDTGQINQKKNRAANVGGQRGETRLHGSALSLHPSFIDDDFDRPVGQRRAASLHLGAQDHDHRSCR